MPTFTEEPDGSERKFVMPIMRTPTKKSIEAIITCNKVVGTNTHWYGGRTIPCEIPKCEACDKGVSWKWHGYVSAVTPKDNDHFLFEMTAAAHDAIKVYKKNQPDLRGCFFKASRPSSRVNGRILIRTKKWESNLELLPDPPDIAAILCHIWNVEPNRLVEAVYQSEYNGEERRTTQQIESR